MENKISIPKPCNENWNEMLPEQQGRHCLACCKTVVDFTGWEMADIQNYLKQRSSERVCGRFNNDQVTTASEGNNKKLLSHVMQANIPILRKIAAVIILCFGLLSTEDASAQKKMGKVACPKPERTEQLQGEIAIQQPDTAKQQVPPRVDSLTPQLQVMGIIAPYHPPVKKGKPTKRIKTRR